MMLCVGAATCASYALDYPAAPPGKARGTAEARRLVLSNEAIEASWRVEGGRISAAAFTSGQTGKTLSLDSGPMPRIVLEGGRAVDLSKLRPLSPFECQSIPADAKAARKEAGDAGLHCKGALSCFSDKKRHLILARCYGCHWLLSIWHLSI